MGLRLALLRRPRHMALVLLIPLAVGTPCSSAQTAAQTATQAPSNYRGPDLFGVCVYVLGDTSFYSNVFSTSGYFKLKAQEAFRQYALTNSHGTPLKGSGCRWSTSQEEVTTQKSADKRLLGLPGRSANGVETGWTYTAGTTTAAQTGQSAATPTAATSRQAANTTATNPSVAASTQQSLNASKNSATGAVNDTVATTMGTVTTGATGALKGIFGHRSKLSSTTAAQPNQPDSPSNTISAQPNQPGSSSAPVSTAVPNPSGSGATGSSPAPMGFINTESPEVATAETQTIQGLVADVAGKDVIINVGSQAGVRPGTKLDVMHPVRTVKDPASGKVLRTVEDKVGELTIKNADATSAAGIFSGIKPAKVGDTVRSQPE